MIKRLVIVMLLLSAFPGLGQKSRHQKGLEQERAAVLESSYLNKPFQAQLVKSILQPVPAAVNLKAAYQALFSNDTTKLLVFFLEEYEVTSRKNKDQLATTREEEDPAAHPLNRYAYIIRGVKYQGKWVYEKAEATYFWSGNPANGRSWFFNKLQDWDFFKDNSAESDSAFWEKGMFAKVEDLRQRPEWPTYVRGSVYHAIEANNRDYVGLYKIVADAQKTERLAKNARLDSLISVVAFIPAYERWKKTRPDSFFDYRFINTKNTLIYPKNRSVLLSPLMVINSAGQKSLHFYVLVNNQFYEWTYFEPKQLPATASNYGYDVVVQLSKITEFDFSYYNLYDRNFWSNLVLAQTNGTYQYLKKLD